MPVLDWIGKKAVVNHHREVPYRLVHCDGELSAGDRDDGNLLVQGDNLEALKALLPYYAGKVKCIYIDPPYNTGNEGWVYNDNVNSPEIKAWLGKVVGKEAEDLSRHDKWLCMMYPRLRLLREFLREDGAIFVSIDDNEGHYLKALLDEIFGRRNFLGNIVWQKALSVKNTARHLSEDHDHILAYAKDIARFEVNQIPAGEKQKKSYKNPDNDPRGKWQSISFSARNPYSKGIYSIKTPSGRVIEGPPPGSYWRVSEENFWKLNEDNRVWWGQDGNGIPRRKMFLEEQGDLTIVPQTIWHFESVGHTQEAKKEVLSIFENDAFPTPKPERLIERIFHISTESDDLVLDSFLGSGTTVAVAHKMGRRWLGIEMGEHAITHCRPRLTKVVNGEQGGISESQKWQGGGGFRYCRLGVPLFNEFGDIDGGVTFPDLAAHVFFAECGVPIPAKAKGNTPLLGTYREKAVYLLFSPAEPGFAREASGNVLTPDMMDSLPNPDAGFEGVRIVYGEGCTVGKERLAEAGVIFKQIPYQIEGA